MYTAVDKEGGSDTRLKVVAPQKLERKKIYEREECFPPSRDSRDSLGREGIVRPKGAGSPSPGALGASIKIAPGKKALRAQAMKKAERPPHTLKGLENVENPEIDSTRETKPQGEKKPLRWLEPIKWLTKLFLSAIFLAWIFVLGILVGRGSLINNPHSGTQGLIPFTSKAALSPQGQALEEPESYVGTSSSVQESPDPGPLGYYQRGESPKLQLQRAPEPRGVGKVTSAQSGLLPPMTTSTLPAPEKDPKAPEKPIEAPTKDISQPSLNYESPFAIALTGEGTGALVRPQAEPPSAMRPNLPTAAISVAGDMVSPSPAPENPSALNPPAEAAAEATIEATAPSTQAVASGEKAPEAPKVKDNPQQAPKEAAATQSAVNSTQKPKKTEYWPQAPKGRGLFTVQLATPKDENLAKKLVTDFRAKGLDAYYYPSSDRFFVRAGRYQSKDEAETAKLSFEKVGAVKPYISELIPD